MIGYSLREMSTSHHVFFIAAFYFYFRLLKQGYSIDQIADCTIQAERIRTERAESISSQKWDKVNEISEGFVRVLRKAIPGSGGVGPKKLIVVANSA